MKFSWLKTMLVNAFYGLLFMAVLIVFCGLSEAIG